MHSRILFGVAAWLLGAATATAGSLMAVSLLGQGITGGSGQLLTQDAVNKELASAAAAATTAAATPDASPAGPARGQPSATRATATPSAVPTTASPTPTPVTTPAPAAVTVPASTAPASPIATTGRTVLTSAGGEVAADCQAAGAYLISWSPQQGYEVGDVSRGPAATARVTFESTASRVTMVVSCSAGVPSATSYTGIGDE